jgi:hypothetical protein
MIRIGGDATLYELRYSSWNLARKTAGASGNSRKYASPNVCGDGDITVDMGPTIFLPTRMYRNSTLEG